MRNKGPWTGINEVGVGVAEYVDWFNQRRLHGELGHVTPAEHEAAHYLAAEPHASLQKTTYLSLHETQGLTHVSAGTGLGHWPEVQPIDTSFTWLSLLTWSDLLSHLIISE
ncbi:IS3 family transposase [Streptomyces sp. NPDC056231]|uniref:IS3 family transposase n=1 Tax=Streptomyces sp. NPDC056231 TaxID=3345755 RepID=UPI003AAD2070